MRDVELMIEILEKLADEPTGRIVVAAYGGGAGRAALHNAELLSDAGLVVWTSESVVRITNEGYDFLNALKQDRERYAARAKRLLEQGKTLLSVVKDIITTVDKL